MSTDSRRGSRLILAAAAINVIGAVLVSILQVWSVSAATPVEYLGRPIVALLLVLPLLGHRTWGRWPALLIALSTGGWLLYSAATAHLLSPDGQVAVGTAGLVVLGAALLPWHPVAAATLRRSGSASAARPAA